MKVKELSLLLKEYDPESVVIVVDSQSAIWIPDFNGEEIFNPKNFENGDLSSMENVKKIITFYIDK